MGGCSSVPLDSVSQAHGSNGKALRQVHTQTPSPRQAATRPQSARTVSGASRSPRPRPKHEADGERASKAAEARAQAARAAAEAARLTVLDMERLLEASRLEEALRMADRVAAANRACRVKREISSDSIEESQISVSTMATSGEGTSFASTTSSGASARHGGDDYEGPPPALVAAEYWPETWLSATVADAHRVRHLSLLDEMEDIIDGIDIPLERAGPVSRGRDAASLEDEDLQAEEPQLPTQDEDSPAEERRLAPQDQQQHANSLLSAVQGESSEKGALPWLHGDDVAAGTFFRTPLSPVREYTFDRDYSFS
eukprot:TRINITY_DN23508_c0_g1_i1.p1 TRINITY_DN23508_c0_g1~~TRINITY_DN23508_c0_g1_i1.p1  ORF type:complete len:313 (-),score=59.71 TRINITY_DN23508_c0_g1_i1:174-1112(-)